MAVSVLVKRDAIETGEERELIASDHSSILGFDVSADGQRFVVKVRARRAATQPLTVVQNWIAALTPN